MRNVLASAGLTILVVAGAACGSSSKPSGSVSTTVPSMPTTTFRCPDGSAAKTAVGPGGKLYYNCSSATPGTPGTTTP